MSVDSRISSKTVVIVGAGLAGLTAARLLVAKGRNVLVLEARAFKGGRLASHTFEDGTRVDIGGQWHGPGQHRVIALASELNLETCRTFTAGKTHFELTGRSGTFRGAAPLTEAVTLASSAWALARLERLAKQLVTKSSERTEHAPQLDAQSLGNWIDRNVWTERSRCFVHFAFQSLMCCDPNDTSLAFALNGLGATGSLQHLLSVAGGSQERYFAATTQQLLDSLSVPLAEHIRLRSVVRHVTYGPDGATVRGQVGTHGFQIDAAKVLIAIPPPLISRIRFEPALRAPRRQLIDAMKMGFVVKAMMVYENPFWRSAGLSGESWSSSGPVGGTYDVTPPGTSRGIITALASGEGALRLQSQAPAQRKQTVLAGAARALGAQAERPLHYVDRVWAEEEWTGGGYAAHVAPGSFPQGSEPLRAPYGALHWAGTETAREWPGYMEGAMESGERAAQEVDAALG